MPTATYDRRRFARELVHDLTMNDWQGSDAPSKIAAARFAVVIEREDDSWALAAADAAAVAGIALGTLTGTEGYDEWISDVYDMSTGEPVEWSQRVTVTLTIAGEPPVEASDTP